MCWSRSQASNNQPSMESWHISTLASLAKPGNGFGDLHESAIYDWSTPLIRYSQHHHRVRWRRNERHPKTNQSLVKHLNGDAVPRCRIANASDPPELPGRLLLNDCPNSRDAISGQTLRILERVQDRTTWSLEEGRCDEPEHKAS